MHRACDTRAKLLESVWTGVVTYGFAALLGMQSVIRWRAGPSCCWLWVWKRPQCELLGTVCKSIREILHNYRDDNGGTDANLSRGSAQAGRRTQRNFRATWSPFDSIIAANVAGNVRASFSTAS